MKVCVVTTQGKEVWHKRLSGKGITGRPRRKIPRHLSKSVINARDLLMSRNNSRTIVSDHQPLAFRKVGYRLIEPLLTAHAQAKFTIIAIDYFTKWVEAEPLSTITEAKFTGSIWKNIICRFGVPHSIITDNGKKFDNQALREMCQELKIHKLFSTLGPPQADGQVEAANKTIKDNLNKKL